jgi:drug/metabolite transporter (DMT)-like permease
MGQFNLIGTQMTQPPSASSAQAAMGAQEWAMLIALSVLWGGSFFFNGVAVKELPSLTIVLARVSIAAVTLWTVLTLLNIRMPRMKGLWSAFFGMGLLNNAVPFTLFVWGQHHIASGLAAILNATTPLFTVLVAHFLTRDEKLSAGKMAGVVLGFFGVILMLGAELLSGLGTGLMAQLACLAAAISYAFAGVFGRRFKRMGVPPLATATGQVTASSLVMLPLVLAVDHPWTLALPSSGTWAALIAIGVASTALAYILYFRILAAAGATNLLLVTFLIPISAILLGSMLLGESLEKKHFVGMGMIGLGLSLIDGRPLKDAAAKIVIQQKRAAPKDRPHFFAWYAMDQKSIPPMPPPGGPPAGAPFGSGRSATIASVVISKEATEAASCSAVRTTLVGSMMPATTRSLYSSFWAS